MNDIFISYAREDRPTAQAIAKLMRDQQWSVWWDREIPIGKSFADIIAAELENAKAVIVLWSKSSVASNWVRDEAQTGADRGNLVPALIEEVAIPYGFRQFQAANLTDWDGTTSHPEAVRLLNDVARLIKTAPVIPNRTALDNLAVLLKRRGAALIGAVALVVLTISVYKIKPALFGIGSPTPVITPRPSAPDDEAARERAVDKTVKGLAEAGRSNYEGAIVLYDEAVRIYAGYQIVYFHRGEAHAILKHNSEAKDDFRKFLDISSNESNRRERQKAQEYIQGLESPSPSPLPTAGQTGPKINATPRIELSPEFSSRVKAIFDEDKTTRIGATTQLVIGGKSDPGAVAFAVKTAKDNRDNKSGVINTLVYLESVDPRLLKDNEKGILELFALVENNGDQTREHIAKVKKLMETRK